MKKLIILTAILAFSHLITAQESAEESGAPQIPSALAEEFDISADSVESLKTNFKIGYGGVKHALELSRLSGKTPEEILTMKTDGKMGWGVIKQELGQGPDKAQAKMDKMERNNRQDKIQRKLDKAALKAEKMQNKAALKAEKWQDKKHTP